MTGCLHGCAYCYARRIADRFSGYTDAGRFSRRGIGGKDPVELDKPLVLIRRDGKTVHAPFPFGFRPTLYHYRLDEPYQRRGQNIFVCSMADLFGEWVPNKWIEEVMKACLLSPQHRYLFLTKNPHRYVQLDGLELLPRRDNFWYGQTVTTGNEITVTAEGRNNFLSIEPLVAQLSLKVIRALAGYDWVIIGAMTGPGAKKHLPARGWVEEIVTACQREGIPVFMKDSLLPVWGDGLLRQFPWEDEP